jgi:hypothetical protein
MSIGQVFANWHRSVATQLLPNEGPDLALEADFGFSGERMTRVLDAIAAL